MAGTSNITIVHKDGETDDPSNFRMLAMTSNLAKPLHKVKAGRYGEYLCANNYINSDIQKAFMAKINGCMEHTKVLEEMVNFARSNKKTLYSAWFDLQDAFGSVPHGLIEFILKLFHIPEAEAGYILDLYKKLSGAVVMT